MSHEIETAMFVEKPAWHQLGVVLQQPPTSAEALKAAGLDWVVSQEPLFTRRQMPGGYEYRRFDDRLALIRQTDKKCLGICSPVYEVLQNTEAFDFFDPMIQEGLATYESAGSLKGGKKVWILARLVKDIVVGKDDELRSYLLLCNSYDGESRLLVQPTSIRVVCNNTLQLSLGYGGITALRHIGGIKANLETLRQEIHKVLQSFDVLAVNFEGWARKQMDAAAVEEYIDRVLEFPLPGEESPQEISGDNEGTPRQDVKTASDYKLESKAEILRLHEEGRGTNPGTLWGVYNAVIEFVDHYAGRGVADRGNYALFGAGARMKIRAMDAARNVMQRS